MIVEIVFWICLGFVLHSYVIYPLLMIQVGRTLSPAHRHDGVKTPSVAVLVAAFNEERHAKSRITNLLGQEYPTDLIRVYFGSDGSDDRTVDLARTCESPRVGVFDFPNRRGKASVINDLVSKSSEDILVFTDANTEFEQDAVRELVRPFEDPRVGAVSGELRLRDPVTGDNCDGTYWRIETAIKRAESRFGGILGANGGIYAIRRSLFKSLPADTIIDDFTIVMNVSAQGHQAIFNSAAVAHEDVPESMDAEFHRRVRIGVGNYQAFFRYPEFWRKASWSRKFTYFSHKVLRWFTPHLLLLCLATSFLLRHEFPYGTLFYAQLAIYALLTFGMMLKSRVTMPGLVNIFLFLFTLNVAFAVAFGRYVRGSTSGQWRRTER